MFKRKNRYSVDHIFFLFILLVLNSCAHYSRIDNQPLIKSEDEYSDQSLYSHDDYDFGDILMILSFSGGGTRAAAFSYGVLDELRDTVITVGGSKKRLLDEVDYISAVSGGSFTAAYYGLFGEQIFDDYEAVFLKHNVQKILINGILNPLNWFRFLTTGFDRSSLAIEYYDKYIFRRGTFGDMFARSGPYIQINATDLGTGQYFGFTKERFDLLCSDLTNFKVARAVAASSAVPVAFAPIALKNYAGCEQKLQEHIETIRKERAEDPRIRQIIKDLLTYGNKEQRRYIHLVDGGISDNLGIRSMADRIDVLGAARRKAEEITLKVPPYIVILLVNAETSPSKKIELSKKEPGISEVVNAVTDAQLSRYNLETIAMAKNKLIQFANDYSEDNRVVKPYFIELKFENIHDVKVRRFFNNVATSLALPEAEVDLLCKGGRQLLQQSTEYNKLLLDLK